MSDLSLKGRFNRAIVTGGAGFIGSHLIEALLADGLEVISIDDYSAGKSENLSHIVNNPNLKAVNADVTDIEYLRSHFDGVDIVFHQACSKNTVCMRDPARDLTVNATGTLNMLLLAKEFGVKKFIHASTGSVYGQAQYFPTDELHPVKPLSYYGVSKLAGEQYVRVFNHLYDMDTVMLRYFHVFGPRQENSDVGGVVSIFARRALHDQPLIIYGDGTQLRSFTYVEDVVRINMLAAATPGISGEAFNCASGVRVTIQELAEGVRQYFGKPELTIQYEEWKPGDIKTFDVSNAKIKSLGFEFQYNFEQGLHKTLDWSREYFSSTAKDALPV
ncbi:MAG: NAD-dependent epimerase/dehydratase family protein [Vampirovibrionales bacterium]|nr:NAD-dependent epimerase/dehydratase family protein [Vampirovibrionales bacterium]